MFSSASAGASPTRDLPRALEALQSKCGNRLSATVATITCGAPAISEGTVQALWFRADEHPEGGEPDYLAFTQMDVLNFVDRLQS